MTKAGVAIAPPRRFYRKTGCTLFGLIGFWFLMKKTGEGSVQDLFSGNAGLLCRNQRL